MYPSYLMFHIHSFHLNRSPCSTFYLIVLLLCFSPYGHLTFRHSKRDGRDASVPTYTRLITNVCKTALTLLTPIFVHIMLPKSW
jgi:hypothetical protein